jgi:hypothetical protein
LILPPPALAKSPGSSIFKSGECKAQVLMFRERARDKLENLMEDKVMTERRDLEELSLDTLDREPWNAVYLPLPEAPSPDLVKRAHWTAEYCFEAAMNRAENPGWRGANAFEPNSGEYGPIATAADHAKTALGRMEELERLDPTLVRMLPPRTSAENISRDEEASQSANSPHSQSRPDESTPRLDDSRPADSSKDTADLQADKLSNVEISDRMRRMLDAGPADELERSDGENGDLSDQLDSPGGDFGRVR